MKRRDSLFSRWIFPSPIKGLNWRVENVGAKVKKTKRGRLIEGTLASVKQENLEVNLPPPSSAYWRNEFQGASSGQGHP